MENIKNMKTDVSDVVAQAVTMTFDAMFQLGVARGADEAETGLETRRGICSGVTLSQRGALDVDFRFRFSRNLLSDLAEDSYPGDMPDPDAIQEDLACAIANIVGSRVKTFLNGKGFDLTMNLPSIRADNDDDAETNGECAQLTFQYDVPENHNVVVLVDIQMIDKRHNRAD